VSPVQPDHSQSLQLILITVWQQDGEKKKSDRRALYGLWCYQLSSESIVFFSSSKSFKQQLLWLQNEFSTSVKLLENPKTLTAIWMPFIAVALAMPAKSV